MLGRPERPKDRVSQTDARRRPIVIRNRYFLLSDILLTILSATLSFAICLDFPLFWSYIPACALFVLLALIVKIPTYYLFGLYRRYWRYASVQEMLSILAAATVSSIILSVLVLGLSLPLGLFEKFPRSVLIIDWLLSLLFIGGIRFSVRFLGEFGPYKGTARFLGSGSHGGY